MNLIKSFTLRSSAAIMAALVVSAPLALPARAQTSPAQSVSEIDRAVAALRAVSTMQANFTQTDRDGRKASGVVTLKRPGRIRFQYAPGIPLLIVSDGAAMTFVDYETRQVQRWPIKNSPLGALLNPTRDVSKFGRLIEGGDSNWLVFEVRDKAHPEYGVITMRFAKKASAPGGLELMGWTALDSQNRQTLIQLSGHRYGMAISDNMFRFNDPRGNTRR